MNTKASESSSRRAVDKFRPVHWSDINQPGAPIIGWGIERKKARERFYRPVGYEGKIHPFASKREAQAVCDQLNSLAQAGLTGEAE